MRDEWYNWLITNAGWLVLTMALAVILLLKYWRDWRVVKKRRNRFKRGLKLEKAAAKFLTKNGYKILEEQSEYVHHFLVDGHSQISTLRPDYVVEKNGRRYVVEVKSGKKVVFASHVTTRRQLLEYAVSIPCSGVFLLDMEQESLQKVEFKKTPLVKKSFISRVIYAIVLMVMIAALLLPLPDHQKWVLWACISLLIIVKSWLVK